MQVLPRTSPERVACYYLDLQPTTFDFATWLCLIKTLGYSRVAFKGDSFKKKVNYPDDRALARLENILKPLCEFVGVEVVECESEPEIISHVFSAVVGLYKEFGWFWKYPYERKHEHICVTIRNSWRNRYRNSRREEWDRFISYLENRGERVVVLEDRENDPIPIRERWDMNCCKMNFGVNNGPNVLCMLSDAPYMFFGYPGSFHDAILLLKYHNIPLGSQLPWAKRNQRIVWKPDEFENLVKVYEMWNESQGAAAEA